MRNSKARDQVARLLLGGGGGAIEHRTHPPFSPHQGEGNGSEPIRNHGGLIKICALVGFMCKMYTDVSVLVKKINNSLLLLNQSIFWSGTIYDSYNISGTDILIPYSL